MSVLSEAEKQAGARWRVEGYRVYARQFRRWAAIAAERGNFELSFRRLSQAAAFEETIREIERLLKENR